MKVKLGKFMKRSGSVTCRFEGWLWGDFGDVGWRAKNPCGCVFHVIFGGSRSVLCGFLTDLGLNWL